MHSDGGRLHKNNRVINPSMRLTIPEVMVSNY